jgi:hypothetical protein
MKTITITVSHLGRINATCLLNTQRGNVGQIRTYVRLAEKLELEPAEQAAIGYCLLPHRGGVEVPTWNRNAKLPDKAITITAEEARRLKEVLLGCEQYQPADLAWIDPLLEQLGE